MTPSLTDRLRDYARFERVLAAVLSLTPLFLIIFDGGMVRSSISEYYDMDLEQIFYVLLTVAAMLFIVNGVIKKEHSYNTTLGVLLAGVILFNIDDTNLIHNFFAITFFAGNAIVIAFFSKGALRFKGTLLGVLGAAVVLFLIFDWFDVFWLEWVSLAAIAVHYILDSFDTVQYDAVRRGEQPTLGIEG